MPKDREDGELSDESPKSGEVKDHGDFLIDKSFSGIVPNEDLEEPSEQTPSAEKKPSNWQKQMRKRLLDESEEQPEETKNKRRRLNCFNCLGDHNIAQCQEPKDFARIRKNKAEFMDAQKPAARISKNVDDDSSKYKPGRLSQKLRSALDLGPDDIPEWVYRMRRMGFEKGYPPGHLKNALKKEYSTIKIFSDDKSKPADATEPEPAPTVDTKKIHYYMGFNKTYGALRDHERGRFEVPPFEIFCEMLQKEVTRDHNVAETIRIHKETALRQAKEMEKANESGDEFVVDRKKTTDDVIIIGDDRKTPTPEPEDDGFLLGESISQLVGTPIVSRRDHSGLWVEDAVPPLEAFAVGIVPFEAKEEEQSRGIFKKIMSTLRNKNEN